MLIWNRLLALLLLILTPLAMASTCGGGLTAPPASITVTVGGFDLTYDQVGSQRISRTVFEYIYSADLTNLQGTAVTGAQASVSSSAAATVITDGSLDFGDLAAGQTVPSTDTFSFQQDRTVDFQSGVLGFVVTTAGSGPSPPVGLATVVGSGVMFLSWVPDVDASAIYRVYRSLNAVSGFAEVTGAPQAGTQFTDRGVVDGTTYFYGVTTEITGQESALSEVAGVHPPNGGTQSPPPSAAEARFSGGPLQFVRLLGLGETPADAASAAGIPITAAGLVSLEAVATNRVGTSTTAELQAIGADAILAAGPFVSFRLPASSVALLGSLASIETVLAPPEPTRSGLPTAPPLVFGSVTEGAVVSGGLDLQARTITDSSGTSRNVNGKGIKIAIFDASFVQNAVFQSQIAPRVKARYCPTAWTIPAGCRSNRSKNGVDVLRYNDFNGGNHGTGVAEIVTTYAPEADLYLYAPEVQSDAKWMILDAISKNVDVIVTSYGLKGRDFFDGTSPFANELNIAGQTAVVVVAAGNEQQKHFVEPFVDDGQGFHVFAAAQHRQPVDVQQCKHTGNITVSCLQFEVLDRRNGRIEVAPDQWATYFAGSTASDLRIHVYDNALDLGFSSYASGTPTISTPISVSGPTSTHFGYFAIEHVSGPAPQVLKIDGTGALLALGSPTSLGRSRSLSATEAVGPNVLAVGATHWKNDFLQSYSSLGPAIGEQGVLPQPKPELTGPTDVSSRTYAPGRFAGTSSAAPHVAGAAALLIDYCRNTGGTSCDAASIRAQLIQKASHGQSAVNRQMALTPGDPDFGPPIYNTLVSSVGAGRVDVSPPIVFSSDDEVIARDPVDPLDPTDGRCDLGTGLNRGQNADVSADGTMVAYEGVTGGNFDIFAIPIDACGGTANRLTFSGGGDRALMPAWSPDGTQIVYVKRVSRIISGILNISYALEVVPAGGGAAFRITASDSRVLGAQWWAFYPHWSPDGTKILFTLAPSRSGGIATAYRLAEIDVTKRNVRLNRDTSDYAVLTPSEPDAARGRYSPDGSRIAYVKIPTIEKGPPLFRGEDGEIRILDRGTGTTSQLIAGAQPVEGFDPEWSPSGARLIYASHTDKTQLDLDSAEIYVGAFEPGAVGNDKIDLWSLRRLSDDTLRSKAPAW